MSKLARFNINTSYLAVLYLSLLLTVSYNANSVSFINSIQDTSVDTPFFAKSLLISSVNRLRKSQYFANISCLGLFLSNRPMWDWQSSNASLYLLPSHVLSPQAYLSPQSILISQTIYLCSLISPLMFVM
jgi:hypothetical protein